MEHKALKDAYARLLDLPEAGQADAAEWIGTFLARREGHDIQLTPEQVEEVKRRMARRDVVPDQEMAAFWDKITGAG